MLEEAMEGASEHKLKCYHLEGHIKQMKIDEKIKLADQKKFYTEIIDDYKNAI